MAGFDEHRDSFIVTGWTVFRAIVPASLVADLRRAADAARDLARALHGPRAQRLQPVLAHDLDHRPFRDWLELPALREAIAAVLGPRHVHGTPEGLGLLFEPVVDPWGTGWHRDLAGHPRVPEALFAERSADLRYCNQTNCALYDDACTWLVPGSHARPDTAEERALAPLALDGLDAEAARRMLRAHVTALPGAVNLRLGPGDYALYRATMWHQGTYDPRQRRATLHDFVDTPEFAAWRREIGAQPKAAGMVL